MLFSLNTVIEANLTPNRVLAFLPKRPWNRSFRFRHDTSIILAIGGCLSWQTSFLHRLQPHKRRSEFSARMIEPLSATRRASLREYLLADFCRSSHLLRLAEKANATRQAVDSVAVSRSRLFYRQHVFSDPPRAKRVSSKRGRCCHRA
jgi:hypothetical protein